MGFCALSCRYGTYVEHAAAVIANIRKNRMSRADVLAGARKISRESMTTPITIPAIELTGPPSEQLVVLDRAIARLHELRRTIAPEGAPVPVVHGRHINAPVWPWFVAGWIVGALFVVAFVVARMFA
jgi:hypothetical protein